MGREHKPEHDGGDGREEFLTRWSRRKLDAGRGDQAVSGNNADTAASSVPAVDEPEKVLTDVDMKPIETLDGDSDYSPFLSPGVSDDLRQQAMRKLFSQPGFNITDGLNDYDEDYTQFTGLGNVITHEMKRMLQRELEAEKSTSTAAADPDVEVGAPVAVEDASGDSAIEETLPEDGPEDTDTKSSL